jgi:hypothetical protein
MQWANFILKIKTNINESFTSLSPRRPGSLRVEFVVDKVALGQVLLRVFRFSPVNIIPPWLHIPIYHLGDEPYARWRLQVRAVVSSHRHEKCLTRLCRQHFQCQCGTHYLFILHATCLAHLILDLIYHSNNINRRM